MTGLSDATHPNRTGNKLMARREVRFMQGKLHSHDPRRKMVQ